MANKSSNGKLAAGVAALAATAAAAYYFAGPKGKQHKKQLNDWAQKAKGEMVQRIKKMKTVSGQTYSQAASEILAKYKQLKQIQPEELAALGRELKTHWTQISKDISKMGAKRDKTPVKRKPAKAKK